jgi:DNA-binding response OmpR family regulator
VVDQNKNVLDFCKRELEREGYCVLVAKEAREALQIVDAQVPDLAVVSDGDPLDLEFTWFVRRLRGHDVPIIVYAASRLNAADMPFWGAEACVEKTGDVAELKTKIAEALKRKEGEGDRSSAADEPAG